MGHQGLHGAAAGHGSAVGPDLAALGSRASPSDIVRAVVDPQAEVVDGYGTISLTTSDGEVRTGTLVAEDDSVLVIDSGGERHSISKLRVVTRTRVVSPMPAIALSLAPRDLRDLIAYLETL